MCSIDDYLNGVIKKHENTRAEKEQDRIRHVDTCNAQTGPIFLAYRKDQTIAEVTAKVKQQKPMFAFVSEDGIGHKGWRVDETEDIAAIADTFAKIDKIYIADGHHRAASAVKVGQLRRNSIRIMTAAKNSIIFCRYYSRMRNFTLWITIVSSWI